MKKSKKNYIIIALVILLLAIAVGYAAFSTTLTITGTASGTTDWDIKFTKAEIKEVDGSDLKDEHKASNRVCTASYTDTTVTATVYLNYPGDAVLLNTTITNAGQLKAKLTGLQVNKGADSDDIVITEATPATNEVLDVGETCSSQFLVKWNPADTDTEATQKTFTVTYTYTQDTEERNATPAHSHS